MQSIVNLPLSVVIAIWILGRTRKIRKFVMQDPLVELNSLILLLVYVDSITNADSWWKRLLLKLVNEHKDRLEALYSTLRSLNVSVVGFIPRSKEGGE